MHWNISDRNIGKSILLFLNCDNSDNTEEYTDKDFDELREYVQALLKFKMLKIKDYTDENILDDGEQGHSAYREYNIVI